ncbi:hypothetical protein [Streptomyces sp. TS71-3]|uniref:hypothetical protein n=1 Tax=Streptomyces sp. TS71-3 TaxID=2733862 RepID=UPI001B0925D3|nr:hypothetical protein [Streptomyces sp. TS71-3]GHJ37996.1 hypothetical protein Sm713_36050 [Streptomyces sp. TS71-3]
MTDSLTARDTATSRPRSARMHDSHVPHFAPGDQDSYGKPGVSVGHRRRPETAADAASGGVPAGLPAGAALGLRPGVANKP